MHFGDALVVIGLLGILILLSAACMSLHLPDIPVGWCSGVLDSCLPCLFEYVTS
jgi:hypothetical protein